MLRRALLFVLVFFFSPVQNCDHLVWGRESWSMCFSSFVCLFYTRLISSFFSSSWLRLVLVTLLGFFYKLFWLLLNHDYILNIRLAPSNEFVSSSFPSWQILTAHAQPFRGARDLAFCLKVPLDSLLVWASSEGSGETARMRRLAWTFAARIGDKYQIRLTRSRYKWLYDLYGCHKVTWRNVTFRTSRHWDIVILLVTYILTAACNVHVPSEG